MFDSLSERLQSVWDHLKKQSVLTEDILKEGLRDVRVALIEADVGLSVIKPLMAQIQEKALGQDVIKSLHPDQMVIKIVHDHLVDMLGGTLKPEARFLKNVRSTILMVGLQGAGKTTTSIKLARYLRDKDKIPVGLCSLDVYRPAAQEQLHVGAQASEIPLWHDPEDQDPLSRAKKACDWAKREGIALILDTAGRLHTDHEMMEEIQQLVSMVKPQETIWVADGMTGQDAVRSVGTFQQAVPLTGIILTRMDGDSRGGACLSMRAVTGRPIVFLGYGEKTDALEHFDPDRIARRILAMGDVMTLIDRAVDAMGDEENPEAMAQRMAKGVFDFNDMLKQLKMMNKMGGAKTLLKLLPGSLKQELSERLENADAEIKTPIAIIQSMTPLERRCPALIKASRRRRIAQGAGTSVMEVNRLLKKQRTFQEMGKRMRKNPQALKQMGRGGSPLGF